MAVPPNDSAAAAQPRFEPAPAKPVDRRESVVIRFVGDSGDGMQVVGMQFTNETAIAGNDLSTLPDFPAEIRAPTGTLAGVSGFQLNFASRKIFTPGDDVDLLVAMNPAALRANVGDLKQSGILIVDQSAFNEQNLRKAGYSTNPLEDGSLAAYQVFVVDISKLTIDTLKDTALPARSVLRCKNFFALGLVSWLFHRPMEPTENWLRRRFKDKPDLADANLRVLRAGFNYGDTVELFANTYEIPAATIEPGTYRNLTGNTALALGLVTAAQQAGLPLFLGSYPITPASDVLHELSALKNFGVITFQAEDEIAGIGSAIGAAFGGALGVTTTSGPGMCLKSEAINLAVSVELPLIIADIQRGGPSTGLPTKTEQADLLMAMYGRNSDSPLPILAPQTPADCFVAAIEAVRIAVRYMTPVILLSDGYLANGAEPWRIPNPADLPKVDATFRTDPEGFQTFLRDPDTLARAWVRPGTPGLEHRIGGLEKDALTGNVSYSPINHEQMVHMRDRKVRGIAQEIPPTEVFGPDAGDLLVVGWGSTYGAIRTAVTAAQEQGHAVAHAHIRFLNPLPLDLGDILKRYKRVLVPEMNMGQLVRMLRAEYLVDAVPLNKVQGLPFKVSEVGAAIDHLLSA